MNLIHIAKIALFTGMTYWLGNIVVLGGAAAYAPQALTTVDHLPVWLNRLAGFAGIVAVICYPGSLASRRPPCWKDNSQVALPCAPGTLLQMGSRALVRVLGSRSM